jgi:hypothetical protein
MVNGSAGSKGGGLQGSSASLPLVDLLQVWSMNHFSGLVTVTFRGLSGHLYFEAGEIVHAEANDLTGEPAVGVILGWPDAAFEPFPNTSTLKRTIHKSVSHLILDAHRNLDERHRQAPPPLAQPVQAAAPAASPPGALQQLRAIRGVTRVVRFGQDGRPVGDGGAEAEALAAKGLYLSMTCATSIAQAFGLRGLSVAALENDRAPFILVHSQGQHLCLAVEPGVPLEPVVAQVRSLLGRPASR